MKKISNSILIILVYSFITVWLILYNSDMLKQTWGNWIPFRYKDIYPFITVMILGIVALTFSREYQFNKLEQAKEDAEKSNQSHLQEKGNIYNQLKLARDIAEKAHNSETYSIINTIMNDFGNKLTLCQLQGYPEVSNLFITKSIEGQGINSTKFEFEIQTTLHDIDYIPSNDMTELLTNLMDQIIEAQGQIESNYRTVDVYIKQDEKSSGLVFEFVHAAPFLVVQKTNQVTSTALKWFKVKQLTNKYKGKIEAEVIDSNTNVIRLYLPSKKEHKKTQVI